MVILRINMVIKYVSIKLRDKALKVAKLDDVGIKNFLKPFL
jgi:hypothetical protein